MLDKIKNLQIRSYLLVVIVILSTLSGVLTIAREMYSGGMYQTFDNDMISISEYIRDNTEKDAIFLTGTSHINPVTSLSGRNVYIGAGLYLNFHGFVDLLHEREMEIKEIYEGSYEKLIDFCHKNNISYIYVGLNEKADYQINLDTFNHLEKIVSYGNEELYSIKGI
jgi:hypothetical protein